MRRDQRSTEHSNSSASLFSFGGSGLRGSMFPSLFQGRDPFDDPFFIQPFGSSFGSDIFRPNTHINLQEMSRSKGPVIKEIDGDTEGEQDKMEEDDATDAAWSNRNPLVEHPEDQSSAEHEKSGSSSHKIPYITNHSKIEGSKPHARSHSFQRVTYGGINGAYYTATTTRRTGSDGVTLEESKQADRTTGEAKHRISRGIHDKGHSVMRKLDSDGKVDTLQTLHNLNEDELAGFEEAWRGNADRHFQSWNGSRDNSGTGGWHGRLTAWEGFHDPFGEHSGRNRMQSSGDHFQAPHSSRRPKKVVTINIE